MSTKKWLCKSCADDCYLAGTDRQISFCLWYKPQTNADRYRAMSDEELARTFAQTGNCPPSSKYGHNCERCCKCWLDYLRQPVKDGEDE